MHEGHRQRLLGKLKQGDNLYEHELLEILLFNAYPRKDVNPVAHALLSRFASIREVLNADFDELTAVEGVGENTALYLMCLGKCLTFTNGCDSFAVIRNTADLKQFVSARFRGKSSEVFELYLMDRNGRVKRVCSYTNNDACRVDVKPEEVMKLISVYRPYAVYIAHNHVNCPARPSREDDELTKHIQLICSINGVRLYDHCIYVSDGDIYSYYLTNRIDEIIDKYNVGSIIKDE